MVQGLLCYSESQRAVFSTKTFNLGSTDACKQTSLLDEFTGLSISLV